jgi:hypothetical protein
MKEYPKEHWENWICPYGLVVISCRECLFDTLCRLNKEKKSDLSNNNDK